MFQRERDRENDDDYDFETVEKIKIRLLDADINKIVPEEFKDEPVFYHPTKLIRDWKIGVSLINY